MKQDTPNNPNNKKKPKSPMPLSEVTGGPAPGVRFDSNKSMLSHIDDKYLCAMSDVDSPELTKSKSQKTSTPMPVSDKTGGTYPGVNVNNNAALLDYMES